MEEVAEFKGKKPCLAFRGSIASCLRAVRLMEICGILLCDYTSGAVPTKSQDFLRPWVSTLTTLVSDPKKWRKGAFCEKKQEINFSAHLLLPNSVMTPQNYKTIKVRVTKCFESKNNH